MVDVTFVIPIGPTHKDLATRAISSVQGQSLPCVWLDAYDMGGHGPGYLRNQMLSKVTTEFVSFLDADDWLEPTFAEETLAEYKRISGGKYIFTDWLDALNNPIAAPCLNGPQGAVISATDRQPYCGGTWHVLTTLLPTQWVRDVGGFDENLPAVEDTEFYLKLCTTFHCGHRLARPLFHYSADGTRGRDFHAGPNYHNVMGQLTQRYGGKMGCCGGDNTIVPPTGERQPEDVQAMALWHGNRAEYGRVTGRMYPRMSFPKTAWVDARDVQQSPALWKRLELPPVDRPEGLTQVSQIAELAMGGIIHKGKLTQADVSFVEPPPPPVTAKPNVARVVALAKATGDPVFVFSEKEYPSYSDIRRLVELSGFKAVTVKQIDAFSRAPLIVVSPEAIPDLNGLKARVICWQLEYAGDYTHNYDGFAGEVWASEKAWADEHGAKYVLMGSHPDLAMLGGGSLAPVGALKPYDVTMLGYMTPRRQSIKGKLNALNWPDDYPGHDTAQRTLTLMQTRLMLHVHQHNGPPYCAPQRIAIAAAYNMPVVSETVRDAGLLKGFVDYASYVNIPSAVNKLLKHADTLRENSTALHDYLCNTHPFRTCVDEALKS